MIKALFLSVSLIPLVLVTGCFTSKAEKRAKESSTIAADVEESFRQRWVAKRTTELTTPGTTADAARAQAETEFRDRFVYTKAAKK